MPFEFSYSVADEDKVYSHAESRPSPGAVRIIYSCIIVMRFRLPP
jgi:hypothetical protein